MECFNSIYWICSPWFNSQWSSIDSDNGLAPNRRQAIIWNNDGLGHWCIYASLGLGGAVQIHRCTWPDDCMGEIQNSQTCITILEFMGMIIQGSLIQRNKYIRHCSIKTNKYLEINEICIRLLHIPLCSHLFTAKWIIRWLSLTALR